MIHPDTEVKEVNARVGLGVFVTRSIRQGELVWVLDPLDRRLSMEEVASLPPALREEVERRCYINGGGRPVFCWDAGRLTNHSCDPNTLALGFSFEIARRDIEAGEQLTCDYATLNMTGSFLCVCGSPGCRGRVSAADGAALVGRWDDWTREALRRAATVEQVLLPYADPVPSERVIVEALRARLIPRPPPAALLLAGAHRGYRPTGIDNGRLWTLV